MRPDQSLRTCCSGAVWPHQVGTCAPMCIKCTCTAHVRVIRRVKGEGRTCSCATTTGNTTSRGKPTCTSYLQVCYAYWRLLATPTVVSVPNKKCYPTLLQLSKAGLLANYCWAACLEFFNTTCNSKAQQ
jgi:hypothetical protein